MEAVIFVDYLTIEEKNSRCGVGPLLVFTRIYRNANSHKEETTTACDFILVTRLERLTSSL